MQSLRVLVLANSLFLANCGEAPQLEDVAADLIFFNGKVITVDPDFNFASALAVKDGRFLRVGQDQDVLSLAGVATEKVDLQGKSVVPGFIDTHIHALLPTTNTVFLDNAGSVAEILEAFRTKVGQTPAGTWIGAFPFISVDQIQEGRLPDRWELDSVSPNNPVLIFYHGHLAAANSLALTAAGITTTVYDPKWVMRNPANGELNGWLLEDEALRVVALFPGDNVEQTVEGVRSISQRLNAVGITGVINQLSGTTTSPAFRALDRLRREGELTLRWRFNYTLPFAVAEDSMREAIGHLGPPTGYGDEWLQLGALGELSFDGWWEPMDTAYLREPYEGSYSRQQGTGDLRYSVEMVRAICLAAAQNDIQMSVHVAGSAALDEVLNIYEEVNEVYPISSKRWTVEHGGFLPTPTNLAQAKQLGVIVATQQSISHYVPKALREMLGEQRAANLFPNRTWLDAGIMVAGGSDFPGAPLSPLLGIYASVTRKTAIGGLAPEEAISREEALQLYTINAAHISFEEGLKGSIEAGKLADFVVLSDDLLTVPEETIKDIDVLMTVVGGNIVYERPAIKATDAPAQTIL
jgi:predicted amidohydrolase YtcJ